jgi:hypothetical protein
MTGTSKHSPANASPPVSAVQDTFDLKSRALDGDQIVRRFALQGSAAVLVKPILNTT